MILLLFFGSACGGGSDSADTSADSCLAYVGGDLVLCLDPNCFRYESVDVEAVEDDDEDILARKIDGTIININMCSGQSFSQTETNIPIDVDVEWDSNNQDNDVNE